MSIDFRPNDEHYLILKIIYTALKVLDYENLNTAQLMTTFTVVREWQSDEYVEDNILPSIIRFTSSHNVRMNTTPQVLGFNASVFRDELIGLRFIGLITLDQPVNTVSLTEEGQRITKALMEERRVIFRPRKSLRDSIFIASAFGYSEIDTLYHHSLKPACETLKYTPIRIDLSEPSQTITEEMMKRITEAECIIADLTHARPSVYFEVGYAHGLGIPLLLTCRQDHERSDEDNARIHFDLAQYKISFWNIDESGEISWSPGMEPVARLENILSKQE